MTITSIAYDSLVPGDNVWAPVLAYLVMPPGEGPFPAVIYSHWLGGSRSTRDEFLDEAVDMAAEKGTAALLVNNIFTYTNYHNGDVANDTTSIIRQVIDLRHGVDILLAQPGVDPERIAFVGHDYGAMYGAVLAGVETRLKGYVLMTGTSRIVN